MPRGGSRAAPWTTANAAVATVSTTGLVTGAADGVVDISATADGISGTAAITVFTPAVLVLSNDVAGNAVIADSFPVHEAHLTFDTLNVFAQTPCLPGDHAHGARGGRWKQGAARGALSGSGQAPRSWAAATVAGPRRSAQRSIRRMKHPPRHARAVPPSRG